MSRDHTSGDAAVHRTPVTVLEDLPSDYRIETASSEVTRDAIVSFAEQFDPQPMHLNEMRAQASVFGELVGSGWQTLAITMRLLVDAGFLAPAPIIGVEFANLRFRQPLRPGDQLQASARLVRTRHSSSRPERGFAEFEVMTTNQDGDRLVEQTWTLMLPTRATQRTNEE